MRLLLQRVREGKITIITNWGLVTLLLDSADF